MVTIRDYERRSDKVYYSIVVNGCNSCKVLSKRYSDLKNLHDLLAQKNVDFKLKLTLPAFPGRKIFGKTKNSVNDIVSRVYNKIILGIRVIVIFRISHQHSLTAHF